MQNYKKKFIEFCLTHQVLRFGDFTLKSGRKSPYFFNAGLFNSGLMLAKLGEFYASAILACAIPYDILFGPAYKGIPLISATAIALATQHNIDKPYCFNRKEVKDHGEGGHIVGAPLKGRVLILDDVITAGTAIRESMEIIKAHHAQLVGIMVSLDRQERGQGHISAIAEVQQQFNTTVYSLIKLDDIIAYVAGDSTYQIYLSKIEAYRKMYGS